MTFWKEYSNYLKSKEWKDFRDSYFRARAKKCAVCGLGRNVVLHHLQYQNYKSKSFSDYRALCKRHHDLLTVEWRRMRRGRMNLREFTQYYIQRERKKYIATKKP